jgi:hypothetical protein
MAFTDACLVRMAEMHPDSCIWTLDSDFRFYRKAGRQSISVVAPWHRGPTPRAQTPQPSAAALALEY